MNHIIHYHHDADKIVTLTLDIPGQATNTMNVAYREAMKNTIIRLENDLDNIAGIIITSAKETFCAGGDLNELSEQVTASIVYQMVNDIKQPLRQLETLGKPVVAAINGAALGGGFELALSTHYRICLNQPSIQLGLPEVTLGLLPAAGGITRMVRLLGIEAALPYIQQGKKFNPQQGKQIGLIHELADSQVALINQAKSWIKANPDAVQPWDKPGYKMPRGNPSSPQLAQKLMIAPAMLIKKTKGCLPAPEKILCAAVEGAQVDFETAYDIESRYFVSLTTGPVAKNMMTSLWHQLNKINSGDSRPPAVSTVKTEKVGVIGAGMMGAGIAYVTAKAGIPVVLKDISIDKAEQGKDYSRRLLQKQVQQGRLTTDNAADILEKIQCTTIDTDFHGCDLIIEAVFEDRQLKTHVTQTAAQQLTTTAVIASNTSTLPITGLAQAIEQQQQFIGLHFFSPVDKMPLVEIIRGKQTSQTTLAKAFDFVRQIRKTPIVVNDSRGFFTSRVFGRYCLEGLALLKEGVAPALLEREAVKAGMPVGPLAVIDEVSLSLLARIRDQEKVDCEQAGIPFTPAPGYDVLDKLLVEYNRKGRAAGRGFYDYPKQDKKQLWPNLVQLFPVTSTVPKADIAERLLFIQSIESLHCLKEGVLNSVADANIGSLFGIGFPVWTGGVLQYINYYGLQAFINRATELAEKYGRRFQPPALLLEQYKTGDFFF
ncbi:enoyl-CoA hydratase/isomerase family protein [Endozoicomonas sp. SM1973]|uniref:enoyl-CoA hydratase n=1 Tax=Spartinivicinus marinus TaxID=2994442 RepID=A0A853I143_9GAMM|nr:3-hydroxyacyl-CoA dehydrogenase NAD-binding domain-containing protein [Spartinivicinus marinus]MCX4029548.1 3-hydroxyacyl-CoA dehydrogenase NAD-binding domain-containing protein [Spartinivicinus marinus]NYZ65122.1 enoyl-CoA hydratase/isomerase family protein [Spartinivicinus marinus]